MQSKKTRDPSGLSIWGINVVKDPLVVPLTKLINRCIVTAVGTLYDLSKAFGCVLHDVFKAHLWF